MTSVKIGIIGGSGLYQMPELTNVEEIKVDTPFGSPSDAFIVGTLEGERVAFLPRHGRGHRAHASGRVHDPRRAAGHGRRAACEGLRADVGHRTGRIGRWSAARPPAASPR